MAERGTEHEARIAREKWVQLETAVDFQDIAEQQADLFAGLWTSFSPSDTPSRVLSVEEKESEIGSYVKWAFLERLKLSSAWKKLPSGRIELMIPVATSDLPPLEDLARRIHKSSPPPCANIPPKEPSTWGNALLFSAAL